STPNPVRSPSSSACGCGAPSAALDSTLRPRAQSDLEGIDVDRESRSARLGDAAQREQSSPHELVPRRALPAAKQEQLAIAPILALHRLRGWPEYRDVAGPRAARERVDFLQQRISGFALDGVRAPRREMRVRRPARVASLCERERRERG